MTKTKLIAAGSLTLALLGSGAAVALAQSGPDSEGARAEFMQIHARSVGHDERGERGMRGHRGKPGEMARNLFEAVDADGDGSVTMAEIDSYRAARLSEVDTSGDGALSIEEFDTLYRDLTRSRMVDAFQQLDADGDGQISGDEMDTRVSRMVERLDRDGDGTLTLERGRGARGND